MTPSELTNFPTKFSKGDVLIKLGRLDEAEQTLISCLAQAQESPRAGNQNLFNCLNYLGNAYTLSNKLELAEQHLNEAKALAEENNFPDGQIALKRNRGLLKYKQHDYESADAGLKDAASDLEKKRGTDSPELIEIFKYQDEVLRALSRETEAEQLSARIKQLADRYGITVGKHPAV